MTVRSGVRTDIGRARARNEDAYLVRDPLFAVADGMGGHRGGNVASKVALETIRAFDAGGTDGDSASELVKDIRTANQTVLARGETVHAGSARNGVRWTRLTTDLPTVLNQVRDATGRFYSLRKSDLELVDKQAGKSIMPSFASRLTAPELTDLVAYLVSLRGAEQ